MFKCNLVSHAATLKALHTQMELITQGKLLLFKCICSHSRLTMLMQGLCKQAVSLNRHFKMLLCDMSKKELVLKVIVRVITSKFHMNITMVMSCFANLMYVLSVTYFMLNPARCLFVKGSISVIHRFKIMGRVRLKHRKIFLPELLCKFS